MEDDGLTPEERKRMNDWNRRNDEHCRRQGIPTFGEWLEEEDAHADARRRWQILLTLVALAVASVIADMCGLLG